MDKLFYKNLKLFLKDLVIVFPEEDEAIQIVTTTMNLAIIDDENNKIIKKFYTALSPLEEQIDNRDISIMNSDLAKNWKQNSYEYQLFFKISENWHTFSDHNKSILWDYIQLLFKLSKNLIVN